MKRACRSVLGLVLLVPLLATGGNAQNPPLPKIANSTGIEVGKHPFVFSATIVCGPLEKDYAFDPQTYGKVRGYAPVIASSPPLVLYTCALTPGFFRLAAVLDALVAKDPTRWADSLVIVSDEKGAQFGGYSVEELIERRKSLRTLVMRSHLAHLSFCLSAPGAKSMAQRLGLTGSQDMLLATLDHSNPPQQQEQLERPVVHSALRLDSSKLTAKECKETAASLVSQTESK